MADTQNAGPPPSAWSPLAVPAFRTVWTATLVANIGAWVASIGLVLLFFALLWLVITSQWSAVAATLLAAASSRPRRW